MARYSKMIDGVPTTVDESLAASTYQATYTVVALLPISTQVTLPNGETYDGTKDELKVERNGVGMVEGVHYQYQNSSSATYITLLEAVPAGGRLDFYKVA